MHKCHCSQYRAQFQPVTLNRSITDGTPLDPPLAPHISPLFYGALVVDTFIGSSGSAEIVTLDVGDDNVSGYAAFEGGRLARAVFVNLHAWLVSSTGERPSVHIDFAFTGANRTRRVANGTRLIIGHADDTSGLTLGGQSYETADVSPSGEKVVERIVLSEGVDLRATEAIMIEF